MPQVGVRTLLISAAVVSVVSFALVSPWRTPGYLMGQAVLLTLSAATVAAGVSNGEKRAFYIGVASFGWPALLSYFVRANELIPITMVILELLVRVLSIPIFLRRPEPIAAWAVATAAIAYAGGCFGRWLYRREHGREPTTAVRQQKSPPPGGEG